MFLGIALAAALFSAPDPVQRVTDESVVVMADYRVNHTMMHNQDICSGFAVTPGPYVQIIATAKHCTEDATVRFVRFHDGDTAPVIAVRKSAHADVAILYVTPLRAHPCASFSADVQTGEPFFLVGDSSGDLWSYSTLHSRNGTHVFEDGPNDPLLAFEGPTVYHGDSGAGVFDMDGNAVAVLDAGDDMFRPAVVFGAPVSYISDLLNGKP